MMTSDKDFAQLVSENIFMYRPGNKWQPTQTWGIKEVLEKFNIKRVNQVIDFLAIIPTYLSTLYPPLAVLIDIRIQLLL